MEHEHGVRSGEHHTRVRHVGKIHRDGLTTGQRVADRLATVAGSWGFIIAFAVFLVVWMIANSVVLLLRMPFDPYPFILLNLVLSCMAAVQAPVIMMSQNRQAARDRLRDDEDYETNAGAEHEIAHVMGELDRMLPALRKLVEMHTGDATSAGAPEGERGVPTTDAQ